MYTWKNSKIKSQYDLQKMMARNNRALSFSEEDLSVTDLKSKNFTSVRDTTIRNLIELAYLRGTLHGLKLADEQMDPDNNLQNSTVILTKKVQVEVEKPVIEERLYFIACKIKNKQDKTVYINDMIKARSEEDAKNMVASNCAIKHQTLMATKIVKSFGTDTMQFQFGIGSKEQESLAAVGRKYL